GFFVEFAGSYDSLGKRIRNSETQKIPYSIIIGDNEVEKKKITIRKYGTGGEQEEIGVGEFIEKIKF
ncbi:threonine--tRNA ligase, partial [Candidatus Gracilibacteria bacterium]|nr:threonine--tRNA ligase [Candidatus Gracilibacteria bacterium]